MSEEPSEEEGFEEEDVEEPQEDPLEAALRRAEEAEREIAYREADLQNARKRFAQERAELARYGAQHLARRMVGVLTDVERALANLGEEEDGPVLQGLRLLHERLSTELEAAGITRIPAKGAGFDPSSMEAITTVPAQEEQPSGLVVEELEPGFMLHDRVLVPSRVVVAS